MRQAYHSTGYKAFDLTECKIHRLVDKETGKVRYVLCYPTAWTADEARIPAVNGKMTGRAYNITEWQEIDLDVTDPDNWPSNISSALANDRRE